MKINNLIISLILFGTPLVFCTLVWNTLELNKTVYFNLLLTLLYLIWFANIIFSQKISLNKTPFFWPILLYLFFIGLSTGFSVNIILSFDFFITQLTLILFYFWIINNLNKEFLSKLNNLIILSALIVSVYAVFQYMRMDFICWIPQELAKSRPIGTFGNPIHLAGFLVMVLPLFLSYSLENKQKTNSVLNFTGWMILISALFLTYCRSGIIAFIVSILFYFFLLGKNLIKQNKKIIVIFLLSLIFIPFILNFIPRETKTIDIYKERLKPDLNVSARIYLWKAALNLIKDKPLLGFGANNFSWIYTKYRYLEPVEIRGKLALPDKVHNEFLELAVSCGTISLLIYLLIIFLFFKLGLKQINKPDFNRKYLLAGYLSAGLAYQVHNFFNFSTLSTGLLWWYLLGAISLISIESKEKFEYKLNFLKYNIIKITTCFLILLSTVFIFKTEIAKWIADYHFKNAVDNRPIQRNWNYALDEYNKSLSLNPFRTDYWLNRGKFLEEVGATNKNIKAFDQAEYSYKQALKINPLNHYIWADWGRVLANKYSTVLPDKRFLEASVEKYQKALELDPCNPAFYNDLANVFNLAGQSKLAENYYLKSLEIYPNSALTHTNLGILYYTQGKSRLAKVRLEKALKLDPNHKTASQFLKKLKE